MTQPDPRMLRYQPDFYGETVDATANRPLTHLFDPQNYIHPQDDGYALCVNPMVDGGLSAITVNTRLMGEALRNFESSVKRMVLNKLFSPKFGEVILTATRLREHTANSND